MRETRIEEHLRKGVEKLGGTCEKFVSPGKKGVPDRLVCWSVLTFHGTPLFFDNYQYAEFIETKAPDGVLKSWQKRDHKRRRAMGFQVHVLWTIDQVDAYLKTRGA